MALLTKNFVGNQPAYGFDGTGDKIEAEEGWYIIDEGTVILEDDKPFDLYAGWMVYDGYQGRMGHHARSLGRWTAWERRTKKDK